MRVPAVVHIFAFRVVDLKMLCEFVADVASAERKRAFIATQLPRHLPA